MSEQYKFRFDSVSDNDDSSKLLTIRDSLLDLIEDAENRNSKPNNDYTITFGDNILSTMYSQLANINGLIDIKKPNNNKIKIFDPINSSYDTINNLNNVKTIFLAGPINGCFSWRKSIIDYLNSNIKNHNSVCILNPQWNMTFDSISKAKEYYQIKWEYIAMQKADVILFIIPKFDTVVNNYGKTTRFELGEYINTPNSNKIVMIHIDDSFSGKRYIEYRVQINAKENVISFNTYSELLTNLKKYINGVNGMIFTDHEKAIKKMSLSELYNEHEEVTCAISNETLWMHGSSNDDDIIMHQMNIEELKEELNLIETLILDKESNALN